VGQTFLSVSPSSLQNEKGSLQLPFFVELLTSAVLGRIVSVMDKWSYPKLGSLRRAWLRDRGPAQVRIVPFGPYGGGQYTSHLIGLVIVIGFIAMALVGIPEARGFFVISLVLGLVFGLFLWLRHRSTSVF
jgi:hypothetical protein